MVSWKEISSLWKKKYDLGRKVNVWRQDMICRCTHMCLLSLAMTTTMMMIKDSLTTRGDSGIVLNTSKQMATTWCGTLIITSNRAKIFLFQGKRSAAVLSIMWLQLHRPFENWKGETHQQTKITTKKDIIAQCSLNHIGTLWNTSHNTTLVRGHFVLRHVVPGYILSCNILSQWHIVPACPRT